MAGELVGMSQEKWYLPEPTVFVVPSGRQTSAVVLQGMRTSHSTCCKVFFQLLSIVP